jgi:transposase-like protein
MREINYNVAPLFNKEMVYCPYCGNKHNKTVNDSILAVENQCDKCGKFFLVARSIVADIYPLID